MKKFFCFFLIMLFAFIGMNAQEEIKFKVDTEKSVLKWKGTKVGGSHEGTVSLKPGELIAENGAIFGTFEIDMESLVCTDIEDAESNQDLIGHLKGDDFFEVAAHPTATLEIQGCEIRQGPDGMPLGYTILGALTIKGITHSVEFPMDMVPQDGGVKCTASFKINRTKWGISYKSKSVLDGLKDAFIYDDIEFEVVLFGSI